MVAFLITPSEDIVLCLSRAELKALRILSRQGRETILGDREATRVNIGPPASVRAAHRVVESLDEAAKALLINDSVYPGRCS